MESVIQYCAIPRTAKEIKEYLNINSRTYVSTHIIQPLINEGKLQYTNSNSINAKNQKYIAIKNNQINERKVIHNFGDNFFFTIY